MRRIPRPFAARGLRPAGEMPRLAAMLVMLAVLWMLMSRAGDPNTWKWFADGPETAAPTATLVSNGVRPTPLVETIVPGPAATDPEERDAAREEFQAIDDRTPLTGEEMPAYWRLARWSRAVDFESLWATARRDLLFTHLWETPEKYRGEPLALRLHIKRVLKHEAPAENSAGLRDVYEAWGWTDESKSWPYLVVFTELPPGLPLGADVHEEGLFVGYFHKLMWYRAYDVERAAPLLIGRLRRLPNSTDATRTAGDELFWPALLVGLGVLVLALGGRKFLVGRQTARTRDQAARESAAVDAWLNQPTDDAEKSPEAFSRKSP